MAANLFPAFIKLADCPCLVVGAGAIAEAKIGSLLDAGGRVTVVAPRATQAVVELSSSGRIAWIPREFLPGDLEGIFLVVAATSIHAVNRSVYREAQSRGILCNAVDDPPNCDFYFPAVVRRGALQIAISTSGESPALAQRLRQELDNSLDDSLGDWVRQLGALRRDILAAHPSLQERRERLHQLASDAALRSWKAAKARTEGSVAHGSRPPGEEAIVEPRGKAMKPIFPGTVYLVGAGPGDPELLTRKAYALLQRADVVLHDNLVPLAIVSLANPHAKILNVGKRCGKEGITQAEINVLMIDEARLGNSVVRLKSGDPAVFGRLAEETDALAGANISYEVVPGITAALAVTASLGVSLTDRRKGSRIVIMSGHRARANPPAGRNDWRALDLQDATLIVYMPGRDLTALRNELLDAGLPADTPAVVVSRATTPQHCEHRARLDTLDALPPIESPSLLLVGRALGCAKARPPAQTGIPSPDSPDWNSVLASLESEIAPVELLLPLERNIAP